MLEPLLQNANERYLTCLKGYQKNIHLQMAIYTLLHGG